MSVCLSVDKSQKFSYAAFAAVRDFYFPPKTGKYINGVVSQSMKALRDYVSDFSGLNLWRTFFANTHTLTHIQVSAPKL